MNLINKSTLSISIAISFILLAIPCISAETDIPKQIVFVRYNLKDNSSPKSAIVEVFKNTMNKRGYVEGKHVNYIDFVTHKPERASAEEILNIAEKYIRSADMFITTGWTSLYVRSKLAKSHVPQLFSPALHSTALNMLPSVDTEPGTNLSGVYLMYPPETIMRLTKLILPKTTKYAFVYDSRIPSDVLFKAAYNQLNENERYGIHIYYLDLAAGTETVLQKMNKMGIEVYGGAVGVMKNLSDLSKNNLPIITSLISDRSKKSLMNLIEQSNIIAGLFNPFDNCGKKAAKMAADIFDAKTTIEKTIPQPAEQFAVINLISAKKLSLSVPFSALEAVDIVIK